MIITESKLRRLIREALKNISSFSSELNKLIQDSIIKGYEEVLQYLESSSYESFINRLVKKYKITQEEIKSVKTEINKKVKEAIDNTEIISDSSKSSDVVAFLRIGIPQKEFSVQDLNFDEDFDSLDDDIPKYQDLKNASFSIKIIKEKILEKINSFLDEKGNILPGKEKEIQEAINQNVTKSARHELSHVENYMMFVYIHDKTGEALFGSELSSILMSRKQFSEYSKNNPERLDGEDELIKKFITALDSYLNPATFEGNEEIRQRIQALKIKGLTKEDLLASKEKSFSELTKMYGGDLAQLLVLIDWSNVENINSLYDNLTTLAKSKKDSSNSMPA